MLNINEMTQEQKFFHNMERADLIVDAIVNLLNEGEFAADKFRTATNCNGTIIGGMEIQLTVVKINTTYHWFIGRGFAPISREDLGVILFEIIWNC